MSIRTDGMDDTQRTFQFGYCSKGRKVVIEVGAIYEVQPLNKNKNRKNRGRICTVLGFRDWNSSCGKHTTERARVKWHDTERIGFVDPHDLIAKTS
ncbi:hypothetical protein ACQ9LF_10150 [Anaerohalosphaeraceae bacterium U12dextr]